MIRIAGKANSDLIPEFYNIVHNYYVTYYE